MLVLLILSLLWIMNYAMIVIRKMSFTVFEIKKGAEG